MDHILGFDSILSIFSVYFFLHSAQPVHLIIVRIVRGLYGRPLVRDSVCDHRLEVREGNLLLAAIVAIIGQLEILLRLVILLLLIVLLKVLLLGRPIRYPAFIVRTIWRRILHLVIRLRIIFVLLIHELCLQLIQLIADFLLLLHLFDQPGLFRFGFSSLRLIHLLQQLILIIVLFSLFLIELVLSDVLEKVAWFHMNLLLASG